MGGESDKRQSIASYPFDGSEGFDVTLRTPDNVDFYTHKNILSIASPFFKNMLTLPQDDAPGQIIDMLEDSKIVDPLLRFCYPIDEPVILPDLALVANLLEAAVKYEMTKAVRCLTNVLRKLVYDQPLEVYAISCRLGLEEVASSAAHMWRATATKADSGVLFKGRLIDWEKTICGSSYIPEMAKMSAGAFFRLTQFVRTGVAGPFTKSEGPTSSSSATSWKILRVRPHDFNFQDSDLTISTIGGVHFYVHHLIIQLASPTMAKHVTIGVDGEKIMCLPEDSLTLAILLRSCYPSMIVGAIDDIRVIPSCLLAAVKYRMAKVIENLKALLKEYAKLQPLDTFFAFVRSGLIDEATEVARNQLYSEPLPSLYVPAMEELSAQLYHCLLEHRHRCLSSLLAVGSDYEGDSNESHWWTIMEKSPSKSIYLASPVVAKRLDSIGDYIRSCSRTCEFCTVTRDLHHESFKLRREFEDSLSINAVWLKTTLVNCRVEL